jgi:hypothetical protein
MAKRILPVLILLLAACLPSPAPADSGVEGQVTVGPMCPVMEIGNPCPDQPYQATLTILTTTSRHKVLRFQTDQNGFFRVALAPGAYILQPESPNVMPYASEMAFTVQAHEFTRLEVVYDSGIR